MVGLPEGGRKVLSLGCTVCVGARGRSVLLSGCTEPSNNVECLCRCLLVGIIHIDGALGDKLCG